MVEDMMVNGSKTDATAEEFSLTKTEGDMR